MNFSKLDAEKNKKKHAKYEVSNLKKKWDKKYWRSKALIHAIATSCFYSANLNHSLNIYILAKSCSGNTKNTKIKRNKKNQQIK